MNKVIKYIGGFFLYDLKLIEILFLYKTKKYLNNYYSRRNPVSNNTSDKLIVYMLDGRAYSGGITDIIRGIISMYKFSKDIGFGFKIKFVYPYSLTDYLLPNLHDWIIDDANICYNSNSSKPIWIYCDHLKYGKSSDLEVNLQKDFLFKLIRRNSSINQFHVYTNSNWVSGVEYSNLFNYLFRPSDRLQSLIDSNNISLGSNYVSITFRFQQSLGDYANSGVEGNSRDALISYVCGKYFDGSEDVPINSLTQYRALVGDFRNKNISTQLSSGQANTLIDYCFNAISDIKSSSHSDLMILITSDSDKFLKRVKELDYCRVISRDLILSSEHLSYDDSFFIKPYLDIFMIANARDVYLVYGSNLYRSGFAKNAALIGNSTYHEVEL